MAIAKDQGRGVSKEPPVEAEPIQDLDQIIALTFQDFDKAIAQLDQIPVSASAKTKKLLQVFSQENLFEEPTEFYQAINDLSEEIGHAYHTVLAIELARQKITPQTAADLFEQVTRLNRSSSGQTPIIIGQGQTPQQLGVFSGGWHYLAERAKSKAVLQAIRESKDQTTPQISTGKEVVDILEFGRQLIPEFNKVYEYFSCSVDHLYFFHDEGTMERFRSDLQKHMNKLAGIVRIFCRTSTEYRKELFGERKRDIAKGALAMKIAETQQLGGLRMSDVYRSMREASGPEDASR